MGEYEGARFLTPSERVARGLLPPGPLTQGVIQPGTPIANEAAIQEVYHPDTPLPMPQQQPSVFSSPKGFYGPGVFANTVGKLTGEDPQKVYNEGVPRLENEAKIVGSLVAPGRSLAGNMLGQMGMAGGQELLSGRGVESASNEATKAGEGALAGGIAGKALGATRNAIVGALPPGAVAMAQATKERVGQAAQYLIDKIPPFKKFSADESGLREMLYGAGKGWDELHNWYDQYMKDVMTQGADKTISLTAEQAGKLGLKSAGTGASEIGRKLGLLPGEKAGEKASTFLGRLGQTPDTVDVNAAEAANKAMGLWKTDPATYRAVTRQLDAQDIGDPAVRAAYKTAMGARDYLSDAKAFGPNGLDLYKSQQGLSDKSGDVLRRRGMGDFFDTLAPGGELITKGDYGKSGAITGALAGGTGAGHFLPGLGHFGGAAGGAYAGNRIGRMIQSYTGIPPSEPTSLLQTIMNLLPKAGSIAAQER